MHGSDYEKLETNANMSENHYASGEKSIPQIVSYCISRALVEDGLLERPIREDDLSDGERIVWYFSKMEFLTYTSDPERIAALVSRELYQSSFLPLNIWEAAVGSFKKHDYLNDAVEKCILPQLRGQIDQMTEEERCEAIRQYLIYNGVLETPIRFLSGNTYFFDENECYRIDKGSKSHKYHGPIGRLVFAPRGQAFFNLRLWTKAVSKFEDGMSLIECSRIFLKEELHQNTEAVGYSYMERLIQHIDSPQFERQPENLNPNSFDRIRVTVSLPTNLVPTFEELCKAVQKHKKEIDKSVIEKIEKDRSFKRFGVPMTFLVLSDVTLGRDYTLEYIFEVRDLKKEEDGAAN